MVQDAHAGRRTARHRSVSVAVYRGAHSFRSQAVTDEKDEIVGVLCGDIQLEEILKHTEDLEAEEKNADSQL